MSDPFELTTPSGLINVTVQPWTETQRAQALHEIRQVVDSLTAAFLTNTGAVCARSAVPVQAGDLLELEKFREFLTRAQETGAAEAYEHVYSSNAAGDQVLEARIPADLNPYSGAGVVALHSHTVDQPCDAACTEYPKDTSTELHTITINGASDDLVEVIGAGIHEEFAAYTEAFLVFTTPTGERLWVSAEFDPPQLRIMIQDADNRGDGNWVLAIVHADPAWTHPVRLTSCTEVNGDPAIELDVPVGTTVKQWAELEVHGG